MNTLVAEAVSASRASRKNSKANYSKIKKDFWKIVSQIKKEETLTQTEEEKLLFHMKKMQ